MSKEKDETKGQMVDRPLGYTYHSHTFRCGHAVGTDEEYVKKAIEGHYEILGFSDHVMLPNQSQPGMFFGLLFVDETTGSFFLVALEQIRNGQH